MRVGELDRDLRLTAMPGLVHSEEQHDLLAGAGHIAHVGVGALHVRVVSADLGPRGCRLARGGCCLTSGLLSCHPPLLSHAHLSLHARSPIPIKRTIYATAAERKVDSADCQGGKRMAGGLPQILPAGVTVTLSPTGTRPAAGLGPRRSPGYSGCPRRPAPYTVASSRSESWPPCRDWPQ